MGAMCKRIVRHEAKEVASMPEVFIHGRGDVLDVIAIEPGKTVRELGSDCVGPSASVWLENVGEPLDPDLTIELAGLTDRCHVHVSDCRDVVIEVRYNGETKEFTLPPALTADRLLSQAAGPDGFDLTEDQRLMHELVITESGKALDAHAHIGSAIVDECFVRLDLSPKQRYEGWE